MSKEHKIAFRADGHPYVTQDIQVPSTTWEGGLEQALAFLRPQWELGTAMTSELKKATSEFSIGHTRGLATVVSGFRTPHHKRWEYLRHGLPENLRSDPAFIAMEPFWHYVLEAMFGQAHGLAPMIERGLVSIRRFEGLSGSYSDVFGRRSGNGSIPGINFRWAHPICPIPRYAFREVALSKKPEIIEGWRP